MQTGFLFFTTGTQANHSVTGNPLMLTFIINYNFPCVLQSQFNELLGDLRVLLVSYENEVQGEGHSSVSTLRTLTETIGNMTSSLATCSHNRGKY